MSKSSLSLAFGMALMAGTVVLSGCGPSEPITRTTTTTEQTTTMPAPPMMTPMMPPPGQTTTTTIQRQTP